MSRFSADILARALRAVSVRPEAPQAPAAAPAEAENAFALAVALCKRFEGFRSHPYLCPAGVPTIGYGSTRYLDGRAVLLTDPPVSREAAERLLLRTLEREFLPAVRRQCPGLAEGRRLAAILDWTYNLGEGNLRASTLRRRVNAGEWDSVPFELRRWVRGGGKVLPGLVARREAEAALV